MRVLIFHGYLLGGTGSNVYNARLAEALVRLGHEVHLFSQDRHPERQPFVDASGTWENGSLRVRNLRRGPGGEHARGEPRGPDRGQARGPGGGQASGRGGGQASGPGGGQASCTVYRPHIGNLLPVYVHDSYEGIEARSFLECSEQEISAYLQANVEAVREVAQRVLPDVALANHLVMGPAILARALADDVGYAVKVHGSALEYTVKRDPQRFLAYAREGLERASAILVGSRHTAESLWRALDDPEIERRTRLGPPGVDVQRFAPREPEEAALRLSGLAGRLREQAGTATSARAEISGKARPSTRAEAGGRQPGCDAPAEQPSSFARDERAAAQTLQRIAGGSGPLVAFVGKLIVSKGADLLIAAWPLVLQDRPDARLLIVGFGAYRAPLERLLNELARGDLSAAREIALAGRVLEVSDTAGTSPPVSQPLRHLLAFLDSLSGAERETYIRAARVLPERVWLSGRLDHEELADVLPACSALVVPSTFPEAFGMVAAEAAACGVPPVSAHHSGLAEVSDALASALPSEMAGWLSFEVDDRAVPVLAERVLAWVDVGASLRSQVSLRLMEVVRARWSWAGVARSVIAAAQGDLGALDVLR